MIAQRESYAVDLLEHPGWKELLADLEREATAARRVIFASEGSAEEVGIAVTRARGSLAVVRIVVTNLYERANIPMPPAIKALFE